MRQEADRQREEREGREEKATSRPKCSTISFKGIAVGGGVADLQTVKEEKDKEDLLARHPLRCTPSAITQTHVCTGAAFMSQKKAYVVAWTENAFQIITPVDLIKGRKDAMLYINRVSAVCLDQKPPSLDFSENMIDFLKHHSRYR